MKRLVLGSYTAEMDGTGPGLTVLPGGSLETPSPSFVIADPTRPLLYAVNERPDGEVSSYTLGDDGSLAHLSTRPTGGIWPCHLAFFQGYVLSANYGSGSVAVHPVSADGLIGERTDLVQHEGQGLDPDRQEGPHCHEVVVGDDGTITVVDLGLDRLVHYRLTGAGRLEHTGELVLPPGTGPRHYVVHPSGRWYLATELSSQVLVIDKGRVTGSVPATATAPTATNLPSGIALSGDARFVYVANRGADSIATFRVRDDGGLEPAGDVPCGGAWPRDLAVAGDRLVVANQKSNTVVTFRLDAATGLPSPTGEVVETGSPTCVLPL